MELKNIDNIKNEQNSLIQIIDAETQKHIKGGGGPTSPPENIAPRDATYVPPAPYVPLENYNPSPPANQPGSNETMGESDMDRWDRMNNHNGNSGGHRHGPIYEWCVRELNKRREDRKESAR